MFYADPIDLLSSLKYGYEEMKGCLKADFTTNQNYVCYLIAMILNRPFPTPDVTSLINVLNPFR